jgi:hypothetical protein
VKTRRRLGSETPTAELGPTDSKHCCAKLIFICPNASVARTGKDAVKDFGPMKTVESGSRILSSFLDRNEEDLDGAHKNRGAIGYDFFNIFLYFNLGKYSVALKDTLSLCPAAEPKGFCI